MEKPGAKKYPPGSVPTERIKTKLQAFVPLLKIFNIRYFKICNRIILLFMLLVFLMSPVLGELVQGINSKILVNNRTVAIGRKLFSTRSDIFYNTTSNNVNNHNHNNNSNICPKEHRIKERDLREEESLRLKRRKDRNNEKDRRLGTAGGDGGEVEEEELRLGGSREGAFEREASECNSCARDKIRIKSLETIKESILSKLGMSQPPNVTERPKQKIADHLLMMLLRKRHSHHGSNGLYWIVQDDDLDEMQGDEPYDSRSRTQGRRSCSEKKMANAPNPVSRRTLKRTRGHRDKRENLILLYKTVHSDKVSSKNSDFSNKSNFLRSHGNASDNKYSDSSEFQEGEVLMEEEDDYHVRTERIVAFSQPHPRIRHLPHIQYFEFSDRLRTSKVKRALLWMYIKGRESTSVVGNKITISIYKILDAGKPGSSGSRESPVITSVRADSTQTIPNGSGAWITMEYTQIKNLVAEWFRYPQHNLGIVISAEDANRTNLAVTAHSGNDTAFVPFLEVYVTDNRKHRTKRTVSLNCNDSSKETRCCRYPLTVDFVEFGWDWIIAPTKYEAFYCAGECPLAFLPEHPHTHVTHLAGNGPCCAPRKLSDLQVLYFDQNMNLIFGKIPAMKVDRCGCT